MGCVSSRRDINDIHPNIFQVMNVDELGQSVSPGQLELTESELVLYQRGKAATRWPLRCLRRYGFDAEIFSFESGRRCPSGPGIYAFRCRRAEQLFNLLQQHIQLRHLSDELVSAVTELTVPTITSGPPVTARQPPEQSYLDSVRPVVTRTSQTSRLSRPGSVTSNGPASPPVTLSPTPTTSEQPTAEHNNNKRVQHAYSNTFSLLEADSNVNSTTQPYVNLEPTSSPTLSSSSEPYAQLNMESEQENCHLYMNVVPGEAAAKIVFEPPLEEDEEVEEIDEKHCYINLNSEELENLAKITLQNNIPERLKYVNYIVLDLEQSKTEVNPVPTPESPEKPTESYATIDFNKTVALSHSVNPSIDFDNEGSRKTRHNSTIGELAPILARHSTSFSD